MLESIAYIEHFGLFRVEGEPIDNRLSWDVYRTVTGMTLYNVARHTDHHLHPLRHCADLKLVPEAPRLPYTYIMLVVISFIPPIYKRLMKPYLDNWDRTFATPGRARLSARAQHSARRAGSSRINRYAAFSAAPQRRSNRSTSRNLCNSPRNAADNPKIIHKVGSQQVFVRHIAISFVSPTIAP